MALVASRTTRSSPTSAAPTAPPCCTTLSSSPRFAPRGYLTDYYTDEAIKVIEANRHRPFFLYLAHWAPLLTRREVRGGHWQLLAEPSALASWLREHVGRLEAARGVSR